jgi:hypothetical protein
MLASSPPLLFLFKFENVLLLSKRIRTRNIAMVMFKIQLSHVHKRK